MKRERTAEPLWRIWVDPQTRVVSFHQVEGFHPLEFRSHDLFQNCIDQYTRQQYRYQ